MTILCGRRLWFHGGKMEFQIPSVHNFGLDLDVQWITGFSDVNVFLFSKHFLENG